MGMLRSSGIVLLIYISFIDIGDCFLNIPVNDKAKAEEKVNVHVVAGNRVKRSTDNNDFPETYDLELTLNGSKLHVHLVKNPKVKTSVPVWTLKGGSLKRKELNEKEESVFYQDPNHGAVFTVQKNSTGGSNMVGVLQVGNEDYVLQSNEDLSNGQTNTKFRITQETVKEVDFSDFNEAEMTVPKIKPMFHKRRKRATGDYQVELLVVVDFSIFQYWYDLSTAPTIQDKETDSIETIRQFYAFVFNGMDAMYKNIQTSAYTMSIVFSGIVIAQTPSDSSWTETIKNTGVSPFQVDSSNGLSNFRTWVQAQSGSLPGHDHAMLFTKYDLTSSGSTSNAGLAYVGVVCTTSSQSIVEDHFGFVMLTVASHELGHSLSSAHDGTGNACSASDYYIMGPSSSPQQNSATATHPWIFSTCSTSYFTNYIDSLESSSSNCMATLDSAYNASALSQYDNQLPGQIYDADAQCVHIRGPGSYFCKDRYSSGFTTICNVLWCADPANPGYCSTSIAADGTHCGNQKWCKTGVCTYDAQAPTGVDSCLYGDIEGPVFSNQPWNCSEVASIAPNNCPLVPVKCCDACAPYLPSTTTTTTQSTTTGTGTTASPPTTPVPTTVPIQLSGADLQCEAARGNGSFLCRSLYNGDFSTICTTMYCSSPSNPSSCQSVPASDGTLCGNQKWCVSNVCTADLSAPTGDESCLYGDRMGAFFSNGWTCADMVANAPNNCPTFSVDCCASCAPYLSPSTTSLVSTTTAPTQLTGADLQCEAARGNGSFLCRALYNGDYSSICTTMWCSSPSDPSSCQSVPASDGTLCGNQKWCISSVCTADLSAPAGDETCLYGDRIGAVFTNGWTCADMVANAPNNCPSVPVQCCASCAPYLSTTAQPTASPTETTTLQVSTTMETSTTSVHMSDADLQCAAALGTGSFMCRSLYNGDFSTICSTMWCSSPTNSSMCQSVSASDETLCGNQKWCLSGVCTADVNAPTSSNEVCLYGDRKGAFFTNGWTCADMVAQAPYNCPSFQISCCASCAPYLTTTSTATQSTPETSVPSTSQPSTPSSLTPTTTSSLSTPPSTPTTTLQPSISPSTPTTTSQPSTPPSTPTTTSQPSTPPSTPTTTSQPSTPPSTTLQLSTPSSTLTTTSQPSTPPSTPTTTSQPSTPPSTATTTSQQSSPPSTPTTTSQPSTPPSTPTTTSQPSTPPSTPTTTSQQSTPPSTPTTTSQPSTPPLSPTTTSQASTPPSTPTTTSQPSTQPSTPTTTSQLSTPPSTPTTTSQPSTPPSTPTTTSQPSTPPSTPTTTSQPSTPPSTPTTTSQPSTPPSTPITTSQPSTPPSTPTTTSQPSTPPSTPTTTSQPSTPPSTPITTSQQTTTQATPPTSTSTSSQTTTAAPSVSTSPTTTPIIIFDPGNFNSGAMRTNGGTEMVIAVLAVVVSLLFR